MSTPDSKRPDAMLPDSTPANSAPSLPVSPAPVNPAPVDAAPLEPAQEATQEATLRAIHLPEDVSWFPLAPGWWALLVLVILLMGVAYWLWQRYQRQAFRREALKTLDTLQQQTNLAPLQLIDELSALLKRVAMTAHGREAVAGRSGDRWLQFLDETGQTKGFTQGPGQCLGRNRFQPQPALDAAGLMSLCRDWIQKQSC